MRIENDSSVDSQQQRIIDCLKSRKFNWQLPGMYKARRRGGVPIVIIYHSCIQHWAAADGKRGWQASASRQVFIIIIKWTFQLEQCSAVPTANIGTLFRWRWQIIHDPSASVKTAFDYRCCCCHMNAQFVIAKEIEFEFDDGVTFSRSDAHSPFYSTLFHFTPPISLSHFNRPAAPSPPIRYSN